MAAKDSHGTKIQRETATPGTYNDIKGVKDFDIPVWKFDVIDVTSHSSAGFGMGDLANVGKAEPFNFEIWYDNLDTEHTGMETDFRARTEKNYKILLTSGKFITFAAKIASLQIKAPVSGKYSAAVTLVFTGAPTYG